MSMGISKDLIWNLQAVGAAINLQHTVATNITITKGRLINSGFYDLATVYQSVYVNC